MRLGAFRRKGAYLLGLLGLLVGPGGLGAITIGQMGHSSWRGQWEALWSFEDLALRTAFLGFTLLGLQCGLLGSFILVRRISLIGDTLAHAVLPGVVLGFCWNMTKNPLALTAGAGLMAWLSLSAHGLITRHTPIKPDASMALVLSGCYGLGAFLISCLQKHPLGAKAGLDRLLFGQAAALGSQDIAGMALGLGAIVLLILFCYKELTASSFDPAFSQSLGLPMQWINKAFMVFLGFTTIVALQAVGALLLSALFILPAATAYLLTRSFKKMLGLSACLAVLAGWTGTAGSFLAARMPTGPAVILAAGVLFLLAFTFSPLHGWLPHWQRHVKQNRKATRENTLKQLYGLLEHRNNQGLPVKSLAHHLGLTLSQAQKLLKPLRQAGHIEVLNPEEADRFVELTPSGLQAAQAVIRKHRLWELYLTHRASFAPDHVHDDAEAIEHILGEALVYELDKALDFPKKDPHGKVIPSA